MPALTKTLRYGSKIFIGEDINIILTRSKCGGHARVTVIAPENKKIDFEYSKSKAQLEKDQDDREETGE